MAFNIYAEPLIKLLVVQSIPSYFVAKSFSKALSLNLSEVKYIPQIKLCRYLILAFDNSTICFWGSKIYFLLCQ